MAERYDVVVCGAGMAGLCAAARAVEDRARVLVIEKGPAPGGSMRMSGGGIWTAPNMDVMLEFVPGGDRVRQARLVSDILPNIEWLNRIGVPRGTTIKSDRQVGQEVDTAGMTDGLVRYVEAHGGEVATSTSLEELLRSDDGPVRGVVVRESDGRRSTIEAGAVILATGGFQGNHELLARWVSRWADRLLRRANPNSAGDGLLAALAIGARTSPNLSTFYGHTMPAPPADPDPSRWTAVTQYGSQNTILVNEYGERFFDESRSMADELAPMETVQQPHARAFLLIDARLHADEDLPGRSPAAMQPNFDNAVAAGAPYVQADTLEALADGMAAWGVSRRGLLATLAEFNEAVAAGRGAELRIPRTRAQIGLVKPPFHALAVRPGITYTYGGIDVDAEHRVLDRAGRPIPGLWAAGADAGGTFQGGYMGGLVLGAVQGPIAGAAAAAFARPGATVSVG
jgi:succinate dehydrogenase/fumarate reductase flavoprotein subunit